MSDTKTTFFVKKPGKVRRTFALVRRDGNFNITLDLPEIDIINKNYREGKLTRDASMAEMHRIKDQQKQIYLKRSGLANPPIPAQNLQLLNEYWDKKYKPKKIVDPASARNRLNRAIMALGDLSILTATEHDIQMKLRDAEGNVRDIIAALSQLFKYLGRDIVLHKPHKRHKKVKYASMEEFELLAQQIQDSTLRDICWIAMATGCRIGEIFALDKDQFVDGCLVVPEQIRRSGLPAATKNRRVRELVVLQEGIPALDRWLKLKASERMKHRTKRIAEEVTKACVKAGLSKKLTAHDLRHSYAIYLLNSGVSIEHVAQSLGDSITVTQEYYTGFSLSKPGIEAIKTKLTKNN